MADFTPLALANIYARFFVEDFPANVMDHLTGSYPVTGLAPIISDLVQKELGQNALTVATSNVIGRFLYECATHALENNIPDPADREAWDHVKNLPSQHHDEIQAVIYQSAAQYLHVVKNVLLGTIGRDAVLTHTKIKTLADERLRRTDTGGVVTEFSWGVLQHGQWLNAALMRAYDLASVFRPGDSVIAYWNTTCNNFAYQYATVPNNEADYDVTGRAEINALLAQSDDDTTKFTHDQVEEVGDSVFRPGFLRSTIDVAQRGVSDVKELIWATSRLSSLADILANLINTAKMLDNDDIIAPITISALTRTYNAVTLALVGIEVLRETKFKDTLIMQVVAEGDDPSVSVTVNTDTLRAFTMANGTDTDLVYFGAYLDPRKGVSLSSTGWSLNQVLEQRGAVIPAMMAEESDRLEKLRGNDATFLSRAAVDAVTDTVKSYLSATSRPLFPYLAQKIDRFGYEIASPANSSTDAATPPADAKIVEILVDAIGDPFLEQVRKNLFNDMTTETSMVAPVAIIRTAIQDAVNFVTLEDPAEADES